MNRVAMVALVLTTALLASGCLSASVRDYVKDEYSKGERVGQAERRSAVYVSDRKPSVVAKDIADARRPADRQSSPSGLFLRYSKDIVAVVPDGRGGSRILIDDERNGYNHFFPILGGWWGSSSGRGEDFRGGGPGVGK